MKLKTIVAMVYYIFFQLAGNISFAQTGPDYFYYYKGEKIPLQVNTSRIALNVETTDSLAAVQTILSRLNITPVLIKEDKTRESLTTSAGMTPGYPANKTFFSEMEISGIGNRVSYNNRIKDLNKIPEIMKASPCFKTRSGKNMGVTNFFYVKLKDENDKPLLRKLADDYNIEVVGQNKFMHLWFTLSCQKKSALNALDAANAFYETGMFEFAEPAFIYEDLQMSADPLYSTQWGLKNTGQYSSTYAGTDINAEKAWIVTKGASNIKIAIFDQGFEMTHPDLRANTYGSGFNAQTGKSPSQILGPHGTAVAGIAGAVQGNSLGISGVAPGCKLTSVSINMLASDPPQSYADGINWAWRNGADVINNSWGGMSPSSIVDNAITNALTRGRSGKGTVMVFATGNSGGDVFYPANSNPLIIAVGAISYCGERKSSASCDGRAWESCYGNTLDVVAPGVSISTTDRSGRAGYGPDDYYTGFSGTSAAVPFVSGVAALVLSANPALTVQQVNDIIEGSARKIRSDLYNYTTVPRRPNGGWHTEMGYGLVDAGQAVLLARPDAAARVNGSAKSMVTSVTSEGTQVTNNTLNKFTTTGPGMKSLVVYPNPATSHVTLLIPFTGNYTGTITDMQGRVCMKFTDARPGIQLPLNNLAPGLYNITIMANEGAATQRALLVKQ